MNASQLWNLVKKDARLEFRNRNIIASIVLYALSTVFVVYMSIQSINQELWISLLFIILLFIVLNSLTKSFVQEGRSRFLYYYQLASPLTIIVSKLFYNFIIVLSISLVTLFLFYLVMGNSISVQNINFICAFLLGILGLSSCITFISGISIKTKGGSGILAILSLPLLIPILLLTIRLSEKAAKEHVSLGKEWLSLLAIDVLIVTLSLILFPYLWRD